MKFILFTKLRMLFLVQFEEPITQSYRVQNVK